MRVHLTDVIGTGAISERLSDLSVYADVDTVQDVRLGGIEFALEYMNEGRRDVELFNPIDYIQYMILDAAGYPVKTPPYVPRPLIQTRDESEDHLENKFLVVSIRGETGREKDVQGELRKKTIMVASNDSYTITLRIQKILDELLPDTYINIPTGDFMIVLTCSLVVPTEEQNESRLLQSGEIPVKLK